MTGESGFGLNSVWNEVQFNEISCLILLFTSHYRGSNYMLLESICTLGPCYFWGGFSLFEDKVYAAFLKGKIYKGFFNSLHELCVSMWLSTCWMSFFKHANLWLSVNWKYQLVIISCTPNFPVFFNNCNFYALSILGPSVCRWNICKTAHMKGTRVKCSGIQTYVFFIKRISRNTKMLLAKLYL